MYVCVCIVTLIENSCVNSTTHVLFHIRPKFIEVYFFFVD